ncbi:MAG: hypothetical protein R2828_18755 [Saprospiraceae bacterium]
MKRLHFVLTNCFIYTLLITSTLGFNESAVSSPIRPSDNGVVQFKLDGADWISGPPGHPELKFEEEAITDGNTLVRIEAFAADGSYLALTIYTTSQIGPGTYPITDVGMQGFFKADFNEGGGYLTNGMKDNPGFITITDMTAEKVVGTFAFAIRNAGDPDDIRQVTAGSFDLQFTKY